MAILPEIPLMQSKYKTFILNLPLKMCLNILKHIEKLKSLRILLTASLCMLWRLQAIRYSQVLVHSTVVNSCDSPQYILTFAFIMQLRKLKHLLN